MGGGIRVRVTDFDDPLGDALRGDGTLEFMGAPLLVYNVRKVRDLMGEIAEIALSRGTEGWAGALQAEFPGTTVGTEDGGPGAAPCVELPTNALVFPGTEGGVRVVAVDEPWALLDSMAASLKADVTTSSVSGSAEVASTAVISGPVTISEGVKIDDFCKIKGPVYLGPRTRVWTGSLVRESMVGADCEIGFGCEIARTYMLGGDRTAHHDVILDSVVGRNVWMGAFVGTTNKLLNYENVRFKRGSELQDTGMKHFGAVFGHDSAIGAGTILLPGRFVPPNAIIQAGTVYAGPADVKS